MPLVQATMALLCGVMAVLLFLSAMRLPDRPRLGAYVLLAGVAVASPLLIRADLAPLRFVVLVPIAATVFKLYDLHASARVIARGDQPDPRDPRQALAFLLASPSLLTFRRWRSRRPREHRPPARAVLPLVGVAMLSGAALVGAFMIDWTRLPFVFEYVTKVSLLFILVPAAANGMVMADRVRGVPARPMFDRIWTAPTPAAFWRRFDTPFHSFCREHMFLRWGGRRHPRLATLAIFAFSAVGHEALFSIAIGRVEGYQLAFFMLNGLVVAATLGWRPGAGVQRVLSTVATIVFMLASGTLFFASVQSVMPFFAER
jgi:hypothetical protein